MWVEVATAAARDAAGRGVLESIDDLAVVYCQTCQYDDAPARLSERLHIDPAHRFYSGIGGTTTQQLVDAAAEGILAGERDVALVVSAEALATQRAAKRRGEKMSYSFRPSERRPFPWEAPPHPAEIAHDVFQAWLTFALFDNARRAHLGVDLDAYRASIGTMLAPLTEIAARNPDAWFPVARRAEEIVAATPANRMVGYPYTKYMVAVMDVDMAAALVLTSHERADALGVPMDQRVYVRGWSYVTDPVYVAEHTEMWRSPAMAAAGREALRVAGIGVDDVAHLDMYSCFPSSLHFAQDALGMTTDDERALSVTGGLPYHGGPASGYMTHSIAQMVRELRADPDSFGLVSGVGMTMTKHAYGLYSTRPARLAPPDSAGRQASVDALGASRIVESFNGVATVAAYSVVHGRDGGPEWMLLVCDIDGPSVRTYARATDPEFLERAETEELVGATVQLESVAVDLPTGPGHRNRATAVSPI